MKKKQEITCYSCEYFHTVPRIKRDFKTGKRFCKKVKKNVLETSKKCEYYIMTHFYYCSERNMRVNTKLCMSDIILNDICNKCKRREILRNIEVT